MTVNELEQCIETYKFGVITHNDENIYQHSNRYLTLYNVSLIFTGIFIKLIRQCI